MKTRITRLALIIPFGLFVLLFSGCYTRLATVEDRRSEPEQYGSRDQGNDSGYYAGNDSGNYYDENSSSYYDDSYGAYPHNRVGFSYYYPSTYWPSYAFSVAYSNPWAYDSYCHTIPGGAVRRMFIIRPTEVTTRIHIILTLIIIRMEVATPCIALQPGREISGQDAAAQHRRRL